MSETPREQPDQKLSRTFLLAWAIAATVSGVLCASTALLLFLMMRSQESRTGSHMAINTPPERIALSTDFSNSNAVSVVLGRTEIDGGIYHLPDWPDGWTRVDSLEGVPCRYMNHRAPNLVGGAYVYFAVHPSFKSTPIPFARVEFEYFAPAPVKLKLQYDGIEDGRRKSYKAATEILQVPASDSWGTAVFHLSEPAFMNSLHGGADFRLDVNPPEIYVRRVTLTRMSEPPPLRPGAQ